jgi:hypothetical protein
VSTCTKSAAMMPRVAALLDAVPTALTEQRLVAAVADLADVDLIQLRPWARLAQEELAEATSLSPRSISDLEHLRRDNTMITTNTAAVSARYCRTRARTGSR